MLSTKLFQRLLPILALAAVCIVIAAQSAPAQTGVTYKNDYTSDDMLLGTKNAELSMSYFGPNLYVNKQTRFTGTWMKRFFGSVKEERVSTKFLMDKGQIREIDWQDRRIFVFNLDRLDKIRWIEKRKEAYEGVGEFLKERYDIKKPELDIAISPEPLTVSGYACQHIKANLKLETVDRHKKASSTTLVEQELWLSRDVPGFADFESFHNRLAERLGIDAQRLGPLTYLLRYWNGSLAPIRDKLEKISGYAVKTKLTVTAVYTTHIDTDTPKTIRKIIKEETVNLNRVSHEPPPEDLIAEPAQFEVIFPE